MQIFRYLRPALVVPVVLAGLAIIPSSASPDAPARGASADPAPVQLLDLTTRSGGPPRSPGPVSMRRSPPRPGPGRRPGRTAGTPPRPVG